MTLAIALMLQLAAYLAMRVMLQLVDDSASQRALVLIAYALVLASILGALVLN